MALVVADRVQETTATTGTGTITLAGAVSGFQSFSVIGDGNTTYYCITSGANWEVGIGTYTTAGTTLARTTILASSAAGAAITLAGTSNVFCVYPASKAVYEDASGNIAGYPFTAGTINSTTIGASSASTGAFTTLSASSGVITDNSTGAALRVTQTGTGNALVVEDSANPDSTPFVIDANGNIGVGGAAPAGNGFYNSKSITGATTAGANNTVATIQSDVTTARGYTSTLSTAAAVFSTGIQHFIAGQSSIGAGSTVTTQAGFWAGSSMVGGTNNFGFYADNTAAVTAGKAAYGFFSNVNTATGGGTTYGFYAAGTANNYFGGNVGIGTTSPTAKLHLSAGTAAANGAPLKLTTGTNLTTAEAGAVEYNGSTFFATANTAPGRGYLPHYAFYIAGTNGGASSGATVDAFPANSSISLAANTKYEIEAVLYMNKSAGAVGTITFTQVASAAVDYMAGFVSISGPVATSAVATYNYGGYVAAGTTGTFAGYNATTLTTYEFNFKIHVWVGASAVNWRLRFVNSVGTVTTLSTSYYLVRALPAASVGTFVA